MSIFINERLDKGRSKLDTTNNHSDFRFKSMNNEWAVKELRAYYGLPPITNKQEPCMNCGLNFASTFRGTKKVDFRCLKCIRTQDNITNEFL